MANKTEVHEPIRKIISQTDQILSLQFAKVIISLLRTACSVLLLWKV